MRTTGASSSTSRGPRTICVAGNSRLRCRSVAMAPPLKPAGGVVDDDEIGPEVVGGAEQDVAAHVADAGQAAVQGQGFVGSGAVLGHRGQLDVVRSGREFEAVGDRRSSHDQLGSVRDARADVPGQGQCPAEMAEAVSVVAVVEDPDAGRDGVCRIHGGRPSSRALGTSRQTSGGPVTAIVSGPCAPVEAGRRRLIQFDNKWRSGVFRADRTVRYRPGNHPAARVGPRCRDRRCQASRTHWLVDPAADRPGIGLSIAQVPLRQRCWIRLGPRVRRGQASSQWATGWMASSHLA